MVRTSISRGAIGTNAGGMTQLLRVYRVQGKHLRRTLARADPRQLALLVFLALLSSFSFIIYFTTKRFQTQGPTIQIGTASVNITPHEPVPLSGYSWRTSPPPNTTVHPSWAPLNARVLVMRFPESSQSRRLVLVALDVVGIDRAYSDSIFLALFHNYGLMRNEVRIVCSHTHSGPFVSRNLWPLLPDDADKSSISRYERFLRDSVVDAVGDAISASHVQPAIAFFAKGDLPIGVNRRQIDEHTFATHPRERGDIDRQLPVIWFRSPSSDRIVAGMYGVAAHAAVLTTNTQYSGDYPGAVSTALEELHPGSTWLYLPGCSGDQNIYPRGNSELLRQHRDSIVTQVEKVLSSESYATQVFENGALASARTASVKLKFAKQLGLSQVQQLARTGEKATVKWAHAAMIQLKSGNRTSASYDYSISAWRLGETKLLFLAGEPTVGYSSKLHNSMNVDWVIGYTDDVMGYLGTSDVLAEGKREGSDRAAYYYGLPSRWHSNVDVTIVNKALELCDET